MSLAVDAKDGNGLQHLPLIRKFRVTLRKCRITKDADRYLFHVTFMEISHKLVDFDPSCLLSMSKGGCRKIAAMHVALNAGIMLCW